jgi:hypothetical protein
MLTVITKKEHHNYIVHHAKHKYIEYIGLNKVGREDQCVCNILFKTDGFSN